MGGESPVSSSIASEYSVWPSEGGRTRAMSFTEGTCQRTQPAPTAAALRPAPWLLCAAGAGRRAGLASYCWAAGFSVRGFTGESSHPMGSSKKEIEDALC